MQPISQARYQQRLAITQAQRTYLSTNRNWFMQPNEVGLSKNLNNVLCWRDNLSRSIPKSLFNCSSLMIFDVSVNYLNGELTLSITIFNGIEELCCLATTFLEKILPSLDSFYSLKQLFVQNKKYVYLQNTKWCNPYTLKLDKTTRVPMYIV